MYWIWLVEYLNLQFDWYNSVFCGEIFVPSTHWVLSEDTRNWFKIEVLARVHHPVGVCRFFKFEMSVTRFECRLHEYDWSMVPSDLKSRFWHASITQWVCVGFSNLNVGYSNLNVGYCNLNGCSSSWQRRLHRSWYRKLHVQEQNAACNEAEKRTRLFSDLRHAQFRLQDLEEADDDDEERRRFCVPT